MWSKACPRCLGDLFAQRHLGNEIEVSCLQCGHVLHPAQLRALVLTLQQRRSPLVAAPVPIESRRKAPTPAARRPASQQRVALSA